MSESERVAIKLCVRNDLDYINEWMIQMKLFEPNEMKLKSYKKGKFVSYNENVFIKESLNGVLEFHIDTDDANANLVKSEDIVEVIF